MVLPGHKHLRDFKRFPLLRLLSCSGLVAEYFLEQGLRYLHPWSVGCPVGWLWALFGMALLKADRCNPAVMLLCLCCNS